MVCILNIHILGMLYVGLQFTVKYFFLKNHKKIVFQAEHALYTPDLDENSGSSDFVHAIWICYKLQCTNFVPGSKCRKCSVQNFVHCSS